jgi:hypothetical protein
MVISILTIRMAFPEQSLGHIQIKCETGVNIFLDGNYCNQTREDLKGLIIQDIPAGKHRIKAAKDGCQSIEQEIDLSPGQVLMLEFTSFIPKIETYEEGGESEKKVTIQTGKIVIQSLPLECSINIPSLDIFGLKKTKDKRVLDKVPVGTHQIEFIALGKTLNYTIQLKSADTIGLMVNFLKDEITMEGGSVGKPEVTPAVQTPQATPDTRQQTAPQFTSQPVSATPDITPQNMGNILFSDTFSAEDKTRPANWQVFHAPAGEYWYIFDQQFCTGNGDNIPGKDGSSWAMVNIPGAENWGDYSIQTSLWMRQNNGRAMILGRWKDNDNFYVGVFETYQGDRFLRIQKVVNGVWTTLASLKNKERGMTLPAMENGSSQTDSQIMIFTLSGPKLRLSIGNKAFVESEDNTFKQGTCGLGEWYYFILFDNVMVNSLESQGVKTSSPPGQGGQSQPVSIQWSPLPAPPSY